MMPEVSTLVLFIGVALLFAASPGPNFIYVLTRSIGHGRVEGFVSVLGIGTGGLFHTLAAVLGLSALLATSSLAFSAVKYAGAAYLIYLGIRTLLKKSEHEPVSFGKKLSKLAAYRQGFVTMVLNPKAALYFFAFLPQFVDLSRGSAAGQLFVFGGIQTFAAVTVYSCVALLAGSVGGLLRRSTTFRRSQRWVTGCAYIALGAGVALGSRK